MKTTIYMPCDDEIHRVEVCERAGERFDAKFPDHDIEAEQIAMQLGSEPVNACSAVACYFDEEDPLKTFLYDCKCIPMAAWLRLTADSVQRSAEAVHRWAERNDWGPSTKKAVEHAFKAARLFHQDVYRGGLSVTDVNVAIQKAGEWGGHTPQIMAAAMSTTIAAQELGQALLESDQEYRMSNIRRALGRAQRARGEMAESGKRLEVDNAEADWQLQRLGDVTKELYGPKP